MNKTTSLALLAAMLMLLSPRSAVGQTLKPLSAPRQSTAQLMRSVPQVQLQHAQMRTPADPVPRAPRRAGNAEVYYKRPAGAFPGFIVIDENHELLGYYNFTTLQVAPLLPYTFTGVANGTIGAPRFSWQVNRIDESNVLGYVNIDEVNSLDYDADNGQQFSLYYWGVQFETPVMQVTDDLDTYTYQMQSSLDDQPRPVEVLPWPSWKEVDRGYELLKSSSDLSYSPNAGEDYYPLTAYAGMTPYGNNENGFWFGKNAGYHGTHVDGIAQIFEKPQHPYVLNEVVLYAYGLRVLDNVEMKCRIYRIDGVPDYCDDASVSLPEVPGELIAVGTAHLAPQHTDTEALISFALSVPRDDGLPWMEESITIDDAIMVVIDGYNDPEMAALADFTAMIGAEFHVDDGYGERAYLKVGKDDDQGNFDGHYQWRGLNNAFSTGEMKTGLTIFLTTELPFLTTEDATDPREYTFPATGGVMERSVIGSDGDSITVSGLTIASWKPSTSNDFSITCIGGDMSSWLSIYPTDVYNQDEFNYRINVQIDALPMPEGTNRREAVVRFAIQGAYLDYKFVQAREGLEEEDSVVVNPPTEFSLSMGDADALPGDTVIIPVSMSNEGDVVALQTDIQLPQGFELVTHDGQCPITLSDRASTGHTCAIRTLADGKIRFMCLSPGNVPFAGNEGELFYIPVKVPADAQGYYHVQLINTSLILANFTNFHVDEVDDAVLYIMSSIIPGDVNGDGEVTVADANKAIEIIINGGSASGGHSRAPEGDDTASPADVNGDSEVTIADVNAILDIILNVP